MHSRNSSTTSCFLLSFLACALFLALPGITAAQDDPPSRVARLNFVQGSVSLQPAGTQDWVEANPNRPLTTGDQLWADEGARGEVHLGSTSIRVSELTGISFLNVSDQAVQIQVAQGTADIRILHMWDNEVYEIDTANLAFTILRPGEYRVDVDPDGTQTIITVRNGAGQVTAGGQTYDLNGGQQYAFAGTDQVNYSAYYLPDPDGFDNWCTDRDHREDNATSARYISREVIGYEDLDAYGTWRTDPTYGPVWVPTRVAVDWAPYHTGHWAFVAPWGWTWVDDAPWGFRAVPLWTLGLCGRRMGMGAWSGRDRRTAPRSSGGGRWRLGRATCVRTGACRICRWRRIQRSDRDRRRSGRSGVGTAGTAGCVGSGISHQRCVHDERQRHEHDHRESDADHERVQQHYDHQQHYQRD